ncbi:glycosyltransferase family 4 protein [Maribacter sp. 1_2014MBL_MicDiv]|uniref:glycosyltransferase family 4 protein n=1 Tax=Maribacter sp. 1_2014MBL_MicDiv TaxID=1644130 RepID=UPI0008F50B1B|nr:glycosyltransferase family 1 protein [Maribacter sp. 1_2014MBL_MicDiv]APA64686.1 mannosyl transferase [Maribacter sp. 1_2014MBL_MicDiv]
MNIIFFSHPKFIGHQSMPRYTHLLSKGLKEIGYTTEVWSPIAIASTLPAPKAFKKWLGYIDQYLFFPLSVRKKLRTVNKNTLFVFTDNALGPWVPLVKKYKHVIHCHDFLAQRSAFEGIDENSTGYTGKLYQKMIRNGYSKGKNFISVSKKTQTDLHRLLGFTPKISQVVYNAMNRSFSPQPIAETRILLTKLTGISFNKGFILHVGGNQWYKNRVGIVEIYDQLRLRYKIEIPLLLIGTPPDEKLKDLISASSFRKDIHCLSNCTDEMVKNAYAGASLLLYPSLDEGFGWPIAEAMASGCPVITTNQPPMTEVGENAAFYIPRRPTRNHVEKWAFEASSIVHKVLTLSPESRNKTITNGLKNVERFEQEKMIAQLDNIYNQIMSQP